MQYSSIQEQIKYKDKKEKNNYSQLFKKTELSKYKIIPLFA